MYGTCAILKLIGRERSRQVRSGKTVKYDAALNGSGQLIAAANVLLQNSITLDKTPEWVKDLYVKNARAAYRERLVLAASLIVAELERLNYVESTPPFDLESDRWKLINLRQMPGETLAETASRIFGC